MFSHSSHSHPPLFIPSPMSCLFVALVSYYSLDLFFVYWALCPWCWSEAGLQDGTGLVSMEKQLSACNHRCEHRSIPQLACLSSAASYRGRTKFTQSGPWSALILHSTSWWPESKVDNVFMLVFSASCHLCTSQALGLFPRTRRPVFYNIRQTLDDER